MNQLAIICTATASATSILVIDSFGRQTGKTPMRIMENLFLCRKTWHVSDDKTSKEDERVVASKKLSDDLQFLFEKLVCTCTNPEIKLSQILSVFPHLLDLLGN